MEAGIRYALEHCVAMDQLHARYGEERVEKKKREIEKEIKQEKMLQEEIERE